MVDVAFSRRALTALSDHFSYLTERNPKVAREFLLEIERTSDLLGEFPKLGRRVEGADLRCHVTRRFRYRIIYLVIEPRLEIRDVLHPSRNWRP